MSASSTGLKVIDCASFIAGPAAATVMSDFGAEVIKIEPPGAGDPYRRRATPPIGPGLASNPGFVLDGRNKKSLALDLRSAAGQAVLRRLVARCRCVHHQLSAAGAPPARHHLRGSGAAQRAADLCLVHRLWRNRPGGRQARASTRRRGGRAPGSCIWCGPARRRRRRDPCRAWATTPRRWATYGAIVTALYQRERTGKGGYVGSSLLANGLWANGCAVQAALCGEKVVPQPPRERGLNALRVHYRCRDGRWLCCRLPPTNGAGKNSRSVWRASVLDDPRFATVGIARSTCARADRDPRRDLRHQGSGRMAGDPRRGRTDFRHRRRYGRDRRGRPDPGERSAGAFCRRQLSDRQQPNLGRRPGKGDAASRSHRRRAQ